MPKHQAFINAYCKAELLTEAPRDAQAHVPAAVNVTGMRLRFNPKAKMKTATARRRRQSLVIDDFLGEPSRSWSAWPRPSASVPLSGLATLPRVQKLLPPEDLSAQIDEFFRANCRVSARRQAPGRHVCPLSRASTIHRRSLTPCQRVLAIATTPAS